MKKIALVVSRFDLLVDTDEYIGGGSVVLRNLIAEWIKNKDIILDIYCTWSSITEYNGINKITMIPFCQYSDIEKFVENLKIYIEKESYNNVLFGDVLSPYGSVMLQSHSYPYRYNLYGGGFRTYFETLLGKDKLGRQRRLFTDQNKNYIAMSEKIRQDYSKNYNIPLENVVVAYPGVKIPDEGVKLADSSGFTFGIVAGSNFNKGAYRFFLALAKLKRKNKNLNAIMVCKNYEKLKFMHFLVSIFGIRNLLTVISSEPDMNKFYKSVDCLAVPSMHDAFALVVLEACANRTIPLVSSNVGASEILTEGENGFIYNINKHGIKNLTAKMQEVIDIKRNSGVKFNQLQENAFDLAKKYTWKSFADKVLESL